MDKLIARHNYKYLSWQEKYPLGNVKLDPDVNTTWFPLLYKLVTNKKYLNIEKELSKLTLEGKQIYPYPDLLYYAFKLVEFNRVKVVFVGQDPYFNSEKNIPQAMGLSFSIPLGITIPSSLKNIFQNMIKYDHLDSFPEHGNLEFLALQGCLFLNTALTVIDGQKNIHSQLWEWFTDEIIQILSDELNNIVFVLWGAPALKKINLINTDKHHVIISSHPSGLSCDKPLKEYPAFNNKDHFGEINKYLKDHDKQEIIYGI